MAEKVGSGDAMAGEGRSRGGLAWAAGCGVGGER